MTNLLLPSHSVYKTVVRKKQLYTFVKQLLDKKTIKTRMKSIGEKSYLWTKYCQVR